MKKKKNEQHLKKNAGGAKGMGGRREEGATGVNRIADEECQKNGGCDDGQVTCGDVLASGSMKVGRK